jgi:serine/threonine-protein kinase
MQLTASPAQVVSNLPLGSAGIPTVDVSSAAATLLFAPTVALSRLVWVSRAGLEQPLNDAPRAYASPRISPDGRSVVVQAGDLWVQDLVRTTFTRLTLGESAINGFPMWDPDGRHVLYRTRSGIRVFDTTSADRGDAIAGTTEFDYPASKTRDGRTLVLIRSGQETQFDIYAMSPGDPSSLRPVVRTPAYEGGVRLSPDERYLAYVSDESGQNEVYLRPFPGSDRRWQVSTQGGTQPVWNPNGKEIFYRVGNKMMAVDVVTGAEVSLSAPRMLFEQRYAYGAGITIPNYDVTPDGRFIMIKDDSSAGRLSVVLNWPSALPPPR